MNPGVILGLFKKIREDLLTEYLRQEWLAYLPMMAAGLIKKMSFEEYKQRSVLKIDTRPSADILAEVAAVRKELKGE